MIFAVKSTEVAVHLDKDEIILKFND